MTSIEHTLKKIYVTITFLCVLQICIGQDLQLSQHYAAPLQLNPALTGGFAAKYRVSASYRDQWRGPLEKPISSFVAGIDLRFDLASGALSGDAIGVGLQFLSDQQSAVDLSTNLIAISGAFHKSLAHNQKKFISGGFQLITGQRNLLYENLVFQDQFDGLNSFDGPTGETLPSNNFGYNDLTVGINYVSISTEGLNFYVGGAVHHLLEPEISFYKKDGDDAIQSLGTESRLFRKYTAHVGATMRLNENLQISPRLVFLSQGPSMRGHLGTNFIIEPSSTDSFNFHVGGWLALVRDADDGAPKPEALGTMVGLGIGDLMIGLSYDFNLRDLINYNSGQGAFELSISYFGNYEDDGGACPTF